MGDFNPHFVVFHMNVFHSHLGKPYLQLNNKGALLMLILFLLILYSCQDCNLL